MLQDFSTHRAFENITTFFVKSGVLAPSLSYRFRAVYIYESDVFFSFRRVSYSRRGFGVSC